MTIDLARCYGGLCPRPTVRKFDNPAIVVHQHPIVVIKPTPSLLELDPSLIAELLQLSLDRCQVALDGHQFALNTDQSPINVLQLVLHALDDSGDLRDRTEQGGSLLTIH